MEQLNIYVEGILGNSEKRLISIGLLVGEAENAGSYSHPFILIRPTSPNVKQTEASLCKQILWQRLKELHSNQKVCSHDSI